MRRDRSLLAVVSTLTGLSLMLVSWTVISPEWRATRHRSIESGRTALLDGEINIFDFLFILIGKKGARADLLWIYAKSYAGDPYREDPSYGLLKEKLIRVISVDPKFKWAYYYGAAMLGWNFNRPQEALEILERSRINIPDFYYTRLLYALLPRTVLKKFPERDARLTEPIIQSLETEIQTPGHSLLIDLMLGSFYKDIGRFNDARRVFENILNSKEADTSKRKRAKEELKEIERLEANTEHS